MFVVLKYNRESNAEKGNLFSSKIIGLRTEVFSDAVLSSSFLRRVSTGFR